jgi:hypothetical protein
MTINLGSVPMVTFVIDADTPDALKQYAGIRLLIGPGLATPPMGTRDTLIISGVSVPGYLRQGTQTLEWVMQGAVDPVVAALDAIPGVDGWQAPAAKALYANIGQAMLERGITLAETKYVLTQAYTGAVANYVAAHPN